LEGSNQTWCTLIDYDKEGERKILAAALYRFGEMSYTDALTYVESLNEEKKAKLVDSLLGRLGKYDVPLRELEYSAYTFDLIMDQGAYAEFKRHRMMTQTSQADHLAGICNASITEAGFGSQYDTAMGPRRRSREALPVNPSVAQHVVPLVNRRVLAQFTGRPTPSSITFWQMRIFLRRIAQRVYDGACPSIIDEI
jgi:hypothetical protein